VSNWTNRHVREEATGESVLTNKPVQTDVPQKEKGLLAMRRHTASVNAGAVKSVYREWVVSLVRIRAHSGEGWRVDHQSKGFLDSRETLMSPRNGPSRGGHQKERDTKTTEYAEK